jgi:hypothetical protein
MGGPLGELQINRHRWTPTTTLEALPGTLDYLKILRILPFKTGSMYNMKKQQQN